jgi:hypothetical protein
MKPKKISAQSQKVLSFLERNFGKHSEKIPYHSERQRLIEFDYRRQTVIADNMATKERREERDQVIEDQVRLDALRSNIHNHGHK